MRGKTDMFWWSNFAATAATIFSWLSLNYLIDLHSVRESKEPCYEKKKDRSGKHKRALSAVFLFPSSPFLSRHGAH